MAQEILSKEAREDLGESFKLLGGPVRVAVFTQKGKNDQYNEMATQLIKEVASVDERIKTEYLDLSHDLAKRLGIERSPTIMVGPEDYHIRFTGTPLGEEGRTLVMALIMASTGVNTLSELSRQRLTTLKEKRHIQVYVSPT